MKYRVAVMLALLSGATIVSADDSPVGTVAAAKASRRKTKVILTVKVNRALTLDKFIVGDETGELMVTATRVKHDMAVGKTVVIWGRYQGSSDTNPNHYEVEVIEAADAGTPAAEKLLAAHIAATSPVPQPSAAPVGGPSSKPSVESRLRDLEDLKSKGLVNDEEYRAARQRILSDL